MDDVNYYAVDLPKPLKLIAVPTIGTAAETFTTNMFQVSCMFRKYISF